MKKTDFSISFHRPNLVQSRILDLSKELGVVDRTNRVAVLSCEVPGYNVLAITQVSGENRCSYLMKELYCASESIL
jgi:hypothetical protein